MPAMLQGIRGDAPETLGGMQMQNNNATSVLRRLAKRFDDYLTRPHIRRYFDWMMQYDDDDSIKGDSEVEVRASSALVERDAQQQFLMQMLNASLDPRYELNPAKFAAELVKGQRLDIKRFQLTEEEKAAQKQQPNPVEQAKAELIAAQTQKTQAETVSKRVETQFSGIQTAQIIAATPQTAGLADGLLNSAGAVDMDSAPIFPQAPEGLPTVDIPENTNPLTPANPAVGMNAGIEGGQA